MQKPQPPLQLTFDFSGLIMLLLLQSQLRFCNLAGTSHFLLFKFFKWSWTNNWSTKLLGSFWGTLLANGFRFRFDSSWMSLERFGSTPSEVWKGFILFIFHYFPSWDVVRWCDCCCRCWEAFEDPGVQQPNWTRSGPASTAKQVSCKTHRLRLLATLRTARYRNIMEYIQELQAFLICWRNRALRVDEQASKQTSVSLKHLLTCFCFSCVCSEGIHQRQHIELLRSSPWG